METKPDMEAEDDDGYSHQARRHPASLPPERRWVADVDTSGINEATLDKLISRVELEMGSPPTQSPELEWEDYAAQLGGLGQPADPYYDDR